MSFSSSSVPFFRPLSPSHQSDRTNAKMENERQIETEFTKEFVERHNELRKLHGCPELTLCEELSEMAKEWADRIAWQGHVSFAEMSGSKWGQLGRNGTVRQTINQGVGENVTVFPEGKCAHEMVDYWYAENRKYEYDSPGWQEGTNYFTQIVWKSTREVGVGRSTMRSFPQQMEKDEKITNGHSEEALKKVVVIAFYRPAGNSNRSGQFELNVPKPIAQ